MVRTGKTSFHLDVSKFVAATELSIAEAIKLTAFNLYADIVRRTPVDIGRARGNWHISIGTPNLTSKIGPFDSSPTGKAPVAQLQEAQAVLSAIKGNSDVKVYITNNLVYIVPLEYGHSRKKAPDGMVRLALIGWQEYMYSVISSV